MSKHCRKTQWFGRLRLAKNYSKTIGIITSLQIVVAFHKPVGSVAEGFQRVPQRRHCLSCQVTSSFWYVKRDCMFGIDNRMTGWSCATWVEVQRDRTVSGPRVEYRFRLRVPVTGSRKDHAHHCNTSPHNRMILNLYHAQHFKSKFRAKS